MRKIKIKIFQNLHRSTAFLEVTHYFVLLVLMLCSFQVVQASPAALTYQGRILKDDGTPFENSNVSFLFQVTDPSGSCVIYQEQRDNYSMAKSRGIFDISIGNGSIQYPAGKTILDIFDNSSSFYCGSCSTSGSTYSCSATTTPYNPTKGEERLLRVSFYDGNDWKRITPENTVRSVPYAGYAVSAQKLGNYMAEDFLLKTGIPNCTLTGGFLTFDGSTLTCQAIGGAEGGTVKTVTTSSPYLFVSNDNVNPVISLAVGTTTNTVARGDDPRIVGAVQSVEAAVGTPITITTSGATRTVGMTQASALADGYLASADWTAFNNKLSAITNVAPLSSGKIWIGDAGGKAQEYFISGDASLASNGVLTLNTVAISKGGTGANSALEAFNNLAPSKNNGSLIVGNGTTNVELAVSATDGYVLMSDNSLTPKVKWGAPVATDILSLAAGAGLVRKNGANDYSDIALDSTLKYTVSIPETLAVNVGTVAGTVAAGDDPRILGAVQISGGTMTGDLTLNNKRLIFQDSGAKTVSLQAPTAINNSYVLKLPIDQGAPNTVLQNDGSGNLTWTSNSVNNGNWSGVQLSVVNGGTGTTSFVGNGVLYGNGTGAIQATTAGTQYQVLQAGALGVPTYGAVNLAQPAAITGVLPVINGGTNSAAALNSNRIMISSGGAIVESSAIAANKVLVSNASGLPIASTVTDIEIGYVSGVTSGIQSQLNSKASSSGWSGLSALTTDGSGVLKTVTGSISGAVLQHSVSGPVFSSASFPSVTTVNQLLYSSSDNVVGGLPTANNAVLTTNALGVPSWSVLSDDLFAQYAFLAGRSGGQTLNGGTAASETLTLESTSHATKGKVLINPSGGNVGIGTINPSRNLSVEGDGSFFRSLYLRDENGSAQKFDAASLDTYVWDNTPGSESTGISFYLKSSGSYTQFGDFSDRFYLYKPIENRSTHADFMRHSNTASSDFVLWLSRARGTYSSPTAVQSGDEVGTIAFDGHTGSSWSGATARITAVASENYSDVGNGTELRIATTPNGATSSSTRMTITAAGNVGIGTGVPSEKLEVVGNIKATQICIGADCRSAWPGGTVTSVTSSNADLNIATTTTTPILTLNSGTTGGAGDANKIAKLNASGVLAAAMIPNVDVSKVTSGTMPIARGGTNSAAALNNNRMMISTGGAIVEQAAIPASRALASDANGLPVASSVTTTELGYLSGVTSGIQAQLGSKASGSGWTNYAVMGVNGAGALTSYGGSTAGTHLQWTLTGPAWTNASFPSVTTVNQLLYSSSDNVVGGLPTANNAVLTTNALGVPSWSVLSNDLFTQYAFLAGRSGGQTLNGGTAASETLTLESTSHATKGKVLINPSGGNVGIGTTNPSSGAAITVDTLPGHSIAVDTYATDGVAVSAYATDGVAVWASVSGSSGLGGFFENTNASGHALYVNYGQSYFRHNVGIGTTAPGAKLDVTDTSTTTSAIIVPRAGNFTGTSINGMIRYNSVANLFEFRQNGVWVNYTTVSDGRLKTNVTPVVNGLDIVNQLNPVFYDWDRRNPKATSFEDKHQVGFIAQEVEKVLPEVVNRGEDNYRSIEYGKIVSVVVAAIKELSEKIMNQDVHAVRQARQLANIEFSKADKSEIENLRAENAELRKRLERIEKVIHSK